MNTLSIRSHVLPAIAWRPVTRQMLDVALGWHARARQRRQLGQLDDRALDDIGIARTAAQAEARKPFWQA